MGFVRYLGALGAEGAECELTGACNCGYPPCQGNCAPCACGECPPPAPAPTPAPAPAPSASVSPAPSSPAPCSTDPLGRPQCGPIVECHKPFAYCDGTSCDEVVTRYQSCDGAIAQIVTACPDKPQSSWADSADYDPGCAAYRASLAPAPAPTPAPAPGPILTWADVAAHIHDCAAQAYGVAWDSLPASVQTCLQQFVTLELATGAYRQGADLAPICSKLLTACPLPEAAVPATVCDPQCNAPSAPVLLSHDQSWFAINPDQCLWQIEHTVPTETGSTSSLLPDVYRGVVTCKLPSAPGGPFPIPQFPGPTGGGVLPLPGAVVAPPPAHAAAAPVTAVVLPSGLEAWVRQHPWWALGLAAAGGYVGVRVIKSRTKRGR